MDGIILINKPKGWTSRDICNKVSHLLHTKKVGHSGTLDPFATGLLLVAIGNATKCIPYCDNSIKTYEAELLLGKKTSTGDLTGENVVEKAPKQHNKNDIEKVLLSFLGKQDQIPPMTSAVHVNGQKLYKLAHKGIEIERKPRQIEIYSIELLDYANDVIRFKCTVSSGTYIRTLGEDIASRLNEVGHLISLNRTHIGTHHLSEAISIDDDLNSAIKNPASFISLPSYHINDETVKKIMDGKRFELTDCKHNKILVINDNDEAIAICENEKDDIFKVVRGLW